MFSLTERAQRGTLHHFHDRVGESPQKTMSPVAQKLWLFEVDCPGRSIFTL